MTGNASSMGDTSNTRSMSDTSYLMDLWVNNAVTRLAYLLVRAVRDTWNVSN